jgi:anti-anti-sigma regulatory factor
VSATLDLNDALCRIRLEGAIDIGCAAELKTLLVQALHSGPRVRLAIDGATHLDVTAIQLLWAAEREASRSGAGIAFDAAPSGEIAAGMREAGLNPL